MPAGLEFETDFATFDLLFGVPVFTGLPFCFLQDAMGAAGDATTAGGVELTAGAAFTEEDDALVLTFGNFFDEEGALEKAEDAALMNSIPGCNL